MLLAFPKELVKSFVKAHSRKLKNGQRVEIAAHYDKRTRKGTEHAPDHGHNLTHLSPEDQARFDAMHREHHLLTFYQGHALKNRLSHHRQAIQTLNERADEFTQQGAHKAATKLRNKAIKLNSAAIRHTRALEKVETATNWLANEKEKRVQGAGTLDTENADKHHEMYVGKMGSPWKPLFVLSPAGKADFGKVPKLDSVLTEGKEYPEAPIRMEEGGSYGKAHIQPERLKEFQEHGYPSAADFLSDVAQHYSHIYEQPNGRLLLVKRNGRAKFASVELQKEADGYYGVTTLFLESSKSKNNKLYEERGGRKLLWPVSPTLHSGNGTLFPDSPDEAGGPSADDKAGNFHTDSIATNGGKEPWQMTREVFQSAPRMYHFLMAGKSGIQPNIRERDQEQEKRRHILATTPGGRGGDVASDQYYADGRDLHREIIEKAVREGKPVPPDVLADYPDLARSPDAAALRRNPGEASHNKKIDDRAYLAARWLPTNGDALNAQLEQDIKNAGAKKTLDIGYDEDTGTFEVAHAVTGTPYGSIGVGQIGDTQDSPKREAGRQAILDGVKRFTDRLAEEEAKNWPGRNAAIQQTGPTEGDVDASGLVFHDGRWHRQDEQQVQQTLFGNDQSGEDDPNSPNYRFRDTGYIAGSRKEEAAKFIKQCAKDGRLVKHTSIDWEEIEKNPREAKELITKSNLFGQVDWDTLKENGMEPGAGFLIDRVYASVAPEPEDSADKRKSYALGLETLRDRLESCKTPDQVTKVLSDIKDEMEGVMMDAVTSERYKAAMEDYYRLKKIAKDAHDEEKALYDGFFKLQNALGTAEYEQDKRTRRKWKPDPDIQARIDILKPQVELADKILDVYREAHPELKSKSRELGGGWINSDNDLEWAATQAYQKAKAILDFTKEINLTQNPATKAWLSMGGKFLNVVNWRSYKGSESFKGHVTNAKNGKIPDWSWAEKDRATGPKGATKGQVQFQLLVAEKLERIGGKPINISSTEALKQEFNIRDVQSGNWVLKDKNSAAFHVQKSAEAMSDLADILGIDHKQLAVNGRLALAFGARGKGNTGFGGAAAAHYEPVQRVINLTKMKGGGCFAHEWFHALDNMAAEMETGKPAGVEDYLTEAAASHYPVGDKIKTAVRALRDAVFTGEHRLREKIDYKAGDKRLADYNIERSSNKIGAKIKAAKDIHEAVRAVNDSFREDRRVTLALSKEPKQRDKWDKQAIKRRDDWRRMAVAYFDGKPEGGSAFVESGPSTSFFEKEAVNLDGGVAGKYWSKPREMMARAFQSYVEDKLQGQGRKNDYLSAFADNKYYANGLFGPEYPFPEKEERTRLNAAFDRLFDALRESGTLQKAFGGKPILLAFPKGLLAKSEVKGHIRTLANGKVSFVREHSDKRTKQVVKENAVTLTKEEPKLRLAPNGKPSNLNALQHAQVRTPQFKSWFGDWEKAAKIEELKSGKATIVEGNEFADFKEPMDMEALRHKARAFGAANIVGEYQNIGDTRTLEIRPKGIKETVQHGSGPDKLKALAALPDVVRNGVIVYDGPNPKNTRARLVVISKRALISGKPYMVTAGFKEDSSGSGRLFYDHELWDVNRVEGLSSQSGEGLAPHHPGPTSTRLNEYCRHFLGQEVQSSKVVDENGEPLVVFHGTVGDDFTSFNPLAIRKDENRRTAIDSGIFFTENKDFANMYANRFNKEGGKVIPVFLDIKDIWKHTDTDAIRNLEYAYEDKYHEDLSGYLKDKAKQGSWYAVEGITQQLSDIGGYDGIELYENDKKTFMVFNPNQAKSAIGNSGAFSPDDNSLTKSKTILLAFPKLARNP
jgi:hypothetical protein